MYPEKKDMKNAKYLEESIERFANVYVSMS